MIKEEIKKIIEENPVAFATLDSKGNPYVIAVAFVRVKNNQINITGTIPYTAPEIFKNKGYFSSDIWSLGCSMFPLYNDNRYFLPETSFFYIINSVAMHLI